MGGPAQQREPCKCRDRRGQQDGGKVLQKPQDELLYILHIKPPSKRHVEYSRIAKTAAEVSHT